MYLVNRTIDRKMFFRLLSWLLVATFFIALLLSFFPGAKWLLSLKDMAILLFVVLNARVFLQALGRIPFWIWGIIVMLGVCFFISPAPVLAKSSSLRQLVMPFVLFLVGFSSVEHPRDFDALKRWTVGATVFLIFAGFLFYFFPFWHWFSLHEYTRAKNLITHPSGTPYMYYEPVLNNLPRMVSTVLDPINLGHLLAFSLVINYYERPHKKIFAAVILLSLLLTICKGAFLQLFIVVLLIQGKKIPRWLFYTTWIMIVIIIIAAAQLHAGVMLHLKGLEAAVKSATLFGYGLGATGNQAVMYGNPLNTEISDTFIGAVLGQIGITGLVLWLVPFAWMVRMLRGNYLLIYLLVSQLLVSVLSENAFNLMSILFLMVTAGAAIKTKILHEEENRHY